MELRVPPPSLPYSANVKLTARLSALAVRKMNSNVKTISKDARLLEHLPFNRTQLSFVHLDVESFGGEDSQRAEAGEDENDLHAGVDLRLVWCKVAISGSDM